MKDAVSMIKDDHKKAKELLKRLEETTERAHHTRIRLLDEVQHDLAMHMELEETIFYPAFRVAAKERDDRIMHLEAEEEHNHAEQAITDLMSTPVESELFSARAKILKELVEHHIEEEEKDMLPRAREMLSRAILMQLGEQMAEAKEQHRHLAASTRASAAAAKRV